MFIICSTKYESHAFSMVWYCVANGMWRNEMESKGIKWNQRDCKGIFTNLQISPLIKWFASMLAWICACIRVMVLQYWSLLHYYTITLLHYYIITLLHWYVHVIIILLHYYIINILYKAPRSRDENLRKCPLIFFVFSYLFCYYFANFSFWIVWR